MGVSLMWFDLSLPFELLVKTSILFKLSCLQKFDLWPCFASLGFNFTSHYVCFSLWVCKKYDNDYLQLQGICQQLTRGPEFCCQLFWARLAAVSFFLVFGSCNSDHQGYSKTPFLLRKVFVGCLRILLRDITNFKLHFLYLWFTIFISKSQ